jgi:hypothetical protein
MDFHHPYTPYDIQETFMSAVYQTLEDSKVGILESPTGTVSSVSTQAEFPRSRTFIDYSLVTAEGVWLTNGTIGQVS